MSESLPAPLVPAEVDLREFAFMPLDVRRLRDSRIAAHVTGDEFRAAVLLWCASWHQEPAGSLPDDDVELAQLAGCVKLRAFRKLRSAALHGFIKCSDGRLYHPVIASFAVRVWRSARVYRGRLNRRLEIESGEWAAIRSAVFERDNFTCRYCRARGGRLECDHVTPLSRGGVTTQENLVTACFSCNRRKGAKTISEWRN